MHRFLTLVILAAFWLPAAAAAKTKVGFIGLLHSHCWRQLENVASLNEVEFVGVAESNPELIAEARKIAPRTTFYSTYREMIDQAKPDFVWAFVENNRHLEVMELVAPRGIHVIFEKPLASTLADARKIRELAKKHKVHVMTNYQMAWWPTHQELKRQVDAGAVGSVRRMHGIVGHGGPGSSSARNKYFFEWLTDPVKNGGGALIDFGCYNALWALWLKGRPETVYAEVKHMQPERFPKVDDHAVLVLSYPDAVGIFEGSWSLPRGFQDVEVFGPGGSLRMTRQSLLFQKGRSGANEISPAEPSQEASGPIPYMASRVEKNLAAGNILALDINVGVVEILEAAKRSVKAGKPIALPLP